MHGVAKNVKCILFLGIEFFDLVPEIPARMFRI